MRARLAWAGALALVALLAFGSLAVPFEGPTEGAPITMEAGRTAVAFHPDRVALSPAPADDAPGPSIVLLFEGTEAVAPMRDSEGAVAYAGLWGGATLRYRATPLGPKYELIVPTAVPLERVEIRAGPHTSVAVGDDGRLKLQAGAFQIADSPLVAWDASGASVACSYDLRGGGVFGFACPGWSRELPLTIDPLLLSTFLGGAQRDEAQAVAFDSQGYPVVVGWTSSIDFPITAFSPDQDPAGGDAFVAKFSQDGTQLVFATFFGGSGFEEAFAVVVDSQDRIWVAGETTSTDMFTTGVNATNNSSGGMDAFIFRLSADGTTVQFSTYFGGSGFDRALGAALSPSGDLWITGETNSSDMPHDAVPFHNAPGILDGFLMFVVAQNLTPSVAEYFGGNASDSGRGIVFDGSGQLVIVGSTNSSDLPVIGSGALPYSGGYDAFVLSETTLTYLGGSGDDFGFSIAVAASGQAYVGGLTTSPDFPSTTGALQPSPGGADDGFLVRLNVGGVGIAAATFLGGDGSDGVVSLTVAPDGSLTAVGFTDSIDFPVTVGAMRPSRSGSVATSFQEAFFSRISADLSTLHYSSYMGEAGADIARGVVVDAAGVATVVGATDASGFPTTAGAIDRTLNSTEAFLFRALQRRPTLSISTDPSGRTFVVNGTPYTGSISGPCSEGVSLPIQISTPQVVGGSRYLFANWSDGGTKDRTAQCLFDQTIEARFTTEFLASLSTDPTGLWLLVDGVNVTAPWSAWWPAGGSHTASAPAVHAANGTRFLLLGWADGGPASRALAANAPNTLLARYSADAHSFELSSDPPGRVVAIDGLNFTCPAAIWLAIGSTHALAPPTPQPAAAGLRYAFTNWSDGLIAANRSYGASAPGALSLTFTAEFEIRLDSDPPGMPVAVDAVEQTMPWSGWRLNGTGISIAPPAAPPERAGVQYGAMSWDDLGASARTWTVWRPETLTALFQPVAYELRLESDPPGVPILLEGSSENAAFSFQPPNAQVSVAAPANFTNGTIRYTFVRWSDVGNRSHFALITEPVTLTAYFSREFEVRFAATPGDSLFRVDGVEYLGSALMWMAEGSVHTFSAAELVPAGTGRRLAFVAWSDGGSATHSYNAEGPEFINLTYHVEVLLTVKTPSGDPTCDVANCWYEVGTVATVTVKSPWNESGGRREILRGWLGNDTAQNLSAGVLMDGPSELTVLWSVQYYLAVTTRYGLALGSGWYEEGAGASFNLSTTDVTASGVHYRFAGWSGDQISTGTSGLVFMDGPKSVIAVWEEVRVQPAEAPLWLLIVLIPAAGAAAAIVVVRRRSKSKRLERAWKQPDEFEPVDPPGQR